MFHNLEYQTRKTCDAVAGKYFVLDKNWGLDKDIISNPFSGPVKYTVLDAGCGPGLHIKYLLERFPNKINKVIGIDYSSEMLKVARKNIGNNSKVYLRKQNLLNLSLPKNSVDVILCMNSVLGNVIGENIYSAESARGKILKNMYVLLKTNGIMIISVYNKSKLNLKTDYNSKAIKVEKKHSNINSGDLVIKLLKENNTFYWYSYWFEKEEIIEMLKKVGFCISNVYKKNKRLLLYVRK